MLISDIENLITSGYTLAKEMFLTPDMYYLNKAANALKCAVTSGFVNMWYLLGAGYYALDFAGQGALMEDNINAYYPTLCSCLLEVDGLLSMLGGQASSLLAMFTGGAAEATDCVNTSGAAIYKVCTDGSGNVIDPCTYSTTDTDGNSLQLTSDNDSLNGCPCYDANDVEYTCPEDMDTTSCFESAVVVADCGGNDCYPCTDDSTGTLTGTANASFFSSADDCSTYDYDADKNTA
jgi:hypothetical protein